MYLHTHAVEMLQSGGEMNKMTFWAWMGDSHSGQGNWEFYCPQASYAKIQPYLIVFGGGDLSHDRDQEDKQ